MEQKVKRLKTLNLSKLNRKTFLEPLAKELDIIPLEYKNKQLLKDAIINKYDLGNPYNKLDPITLCSIQEIPQEYLIKWKQCNNCFAADIRSIKTLFKLIDFKSCPTFTSENILIVSGEILLLPKITISSNSDA